MSTNLDVIHAFVTLAPRDVKAGNLRYDSYRESIYSYDYKIGYWIFAPNKTPYAVIRARRRTVEDYRESHEHTTRAFWIYSLDDATHSHPQIIRAVAEV